MNTKRLMQRSLRRALAQKRGNTATVTLRYETGLITPDLNDTTTWSGEAVPHTDTLRGLVHFISAASILNRGFIELRVGDCIVDFEPQVTFDGMQNLVFEIDGRRYGQKAVGKEVERYYDLIMGDERIFRTVLLSPLGEDVGEPAAMGSLVYVDDTGSAVVFEYDYSAGTFTPVGDPSGRVDILESDDDWRFSVKVAGVLALAIDVTGVVRVKSIDTAHASASSEVPRVEFFRGASRVASLSATGTLSVLAVDETLTNPNRADDFELRDGDDWLASISPVGLEAPAVADDLP